MLMPVLLASLRDNSSLVVKQSIVSGTIIFYGVLEELSMQVPLLHFISCSPSHYFPNLLVCNLLVFMFSNFSYFDTKL